MVTGKVQPWSYTEIAEEMNTACIVGNYSDMLGFLRALRVLRGSVSCRW